MLPDINRLIEYKNSRVVHYFLRDHPHYSGDVDILFADLLRYLWLCKKHALDRKAKPDDESLQFVCVMHLEMREMDNMWHTFILFTREYAEFCHTYFDEFVHHLPNIVEDKPELFVNFEIDCTRYLSYVYDHLGEDTVKRWFAEHLK